jgi:hypothetical protein
MTRGTRCLLLGLLALLLAAAVAPGAAYAEAGPFWHHRESGGKGNGMKIEEKSPENFSGEGGEQIFVGELSGTRVEITSKSVQAKGILYNNALQGQFKLLLKGHEPKLVKPELKGCEVKVGENNELKAEGHLAWKWNGEAKQLEEQPQALQKPSAIAAPGAIEAGATKLPEGSFTSVSFKGAGCGVLVGTFKASGSASALPKPANLEEWSTTLTIAFPGWKQLHFWNGKAFIGASVGLMVGGNPATITGAAVSKAAVQEVAAFEK